MPRLLLAAAALMLLVTAGSAAPVAAPPNIILVLIDDMGWGDFSCFGNREARTEHIDRLAAEGLRFEVLRQRADLLAVARGDPHRPVPAALADHVLPGQPEAERGARHGPVARSRGADAARTLQRAGYATGHFGKWHMGGQRDVGDAPSIAAYGFDESLTNFEGLGPRVLPLLDRLRRHGAPTLRARLRQARRGDITWHDRAQVTSRFVSAALAFITRAEAAGRPFYVNLWPDDVHSPFFPPRDRRGDGSKRALYLGVLEAMDEQLGVLFDHVRASERLRDNTLILVCPTTARSRARARPDRSAGTKGTLYEGGIRSPLIVWGPGMMRRPAIGSVDRQSVIAAMDLAPSLLQLAGAAPGPGAGLDGVPMQDVLLGKARERRATRIFFRRPPDRDRIDGHDDLPDLAVRDGRWKLLCEYDGSEPQLYDLIDDPDEGTDVAARHPARVRTLTKALLAWHRSMPADAGATYTAAP